MASKRQRFEAFKRDKFTCQYCGRRPPDVTLEADHIVPRKDGGPDTLENLTTSCVDCNRGKAAIPLGDVAPALDEMEQMAAMQEMLERKRDLRSQIAVAQAMRDEEDGAIQYVKDLWIDATCEEDGDGFDWEGVRRFLARGLTVNDLRIAIATTRSFSHENRWKKPWQLWKYCCAICWNWLRERESENEARDDG